MKVATSANSVTEHHTFFSLFIIPFEFNASIKKIILGTPMKTTSATMLVYSTVWQTNIIGCVIHAYLLYSGYFPANDVILACSDTFFASAWLEKKT